MVPPACEELSSPANLFPQVQARELTVKTIVSRNPCLGCINSSLFNRQLSIFSGSSESSVGCSGGI